MILDPNKASATFHSYGSVKDKPKISRKVYEKVFEGEVTAHSLEEIFMIFNFEYVDGFTGRSMSTSDVVEVVKDCDGVGRGFYYCDHDRFVPICDFEEADHEIVDSTEEVIEVAPKPVNPRKKDESKPFAGKLEKCFCPVCGKELPCMGATPKTIKDKEYIASSFFCGKCEISIIVESNSSLV